MELIIANQALADLSAEALPKAETRKEKNSAQLRATLHNSARKKLCENQGH